MQPIVSFVRVDAFHHCLCTI